jgi:hypothetical protein
MNAREAYEKALWNSLPEKLRKEIEDSIKGGQIVGIYFFESVYPEIFEKSDIVLKTLKKLGYNANIYSINFHGEDDRKLTVMWGGNYNV